MIIYRTKINSKSYLSEYYYSSWTLISYKKKKTVEVFDMDFKNSIQIYIRSRVAYLIRIDADGLSISG